MLWQAFGRWGAFSQQGDIPGAGVGSFLFDGVNDYIELGSAPVTAAPLTIVAWMKSSNDSTRAIGGLFNSGGTQLFQLAKHDNPQRDVSAETWNGGSSGKAQGGDFPLSTWCHLGGVFTAANSRNMYLNGSSVGTSTTSITPTGINAVEIGCNIFSGARGAFFNGRIAHFAIWNIALSGAEIASLAAGALPSSVQAANLKFYAPLTNGLAKDTVTNTSLTVSGAVTDPDGPI